MRSYCYGRVHKRLLLFQNLALTENIVQFSMRRAYPMILKQGSCQDERCCNGNVASVVECCHVSDSNGKDIPWPVTESEESVVEKWEENCSFESSEDSSSEEWLTCHGANTIIFYRNFCQVLPKRGNGSTEITSVDIDQWDGEEAKGECKGKDSVQCRHGHWDGPDVNAQMWGHWSS